MCLPYVFFVKKCIVKHFNGLDIYLKKVFQVDGEIPARPVNKLIMLEKLFNLKLRKLLLGNSILIYAEYQVH